MNTQYFTGKYGVATTIYFTLEDPAATSSDLLFDGTAPLQADMLIFKDGVYDSTSDNAPAQINSDRLYSVAISAAEMTANRVDVIVHDASATTFRDAHLVVLTHVALGSADIDAATGTKANTTALKLTGYGSGHGLECVKGATGNDIDAALGKHVLRAGTCQSGSASSAVLDSSASATNDYYNGALILFHTGTGAGQARVITDYAGATTTCTLNKALASALGADTEYVILPGPDSWAISPGAELSAMPTYASTMMQIVQFLFQRFAYKREQTATDFSMKKVDDSTELDNATLSDNGTTQSFGRIGA